MAILREDPALAKLRMLGMKYRTQNIRIVGLVGRKNTRINIKMKNTLRYVSPYRQRYSRRATYRRTISNPSNTTPQVTNTCCAKFIHRYYTANLSKIISPIIGMSHGGSCIIGNSSVKCDDSRLHSETCGRIDI